MKRFTKIVSFIIILALVFSAINIVTINPVAADSGNNGFVKIAAGGDFSLALKADGSLWAWGDDEYGSLGDGNKQKCTVPEKIMDRGVKAIAAGNRHALALKTDGSVWAWGYGYSGEVGDGTSGYNNHYYTPTKIIAGGVVSIAVGLEHSLAIKTDGSLWAWGWNLYGQLGDGTKINRLVPTKIISSGVVAVSAGERNTIAMKIDGSVWGWGDNTYGQLGDGTTNQSLAPKQIIANGVTTIDSGFSFCTAIKTDGSLWAWGKNDLGQLGDGTTTNRLAPKQIIANGVTNIAAGYSQSFYIKSDGSLWGWGSAYLGDGTSNISTTPKQIIATGVVCVSSGGAHNLLLKTDGSLWSWGSNTYGQLGDGTLTTRLSPVMYTEITKILGQYAVISNESTDDSSSASTGSFSREDASSMTAADSNLSPEAFSKDYVMPLNKNISANMAQFKIQASKQLLSVQYNVGDTKTFWVANFITQSYYSFTATLKSSGTKSNVWVNLSDYNMSTTDANKITAEFDSNIYTKITNIFGLPSDVDNNGKVNILCYDIQDGFSGSGGYISGYFDPNDLYANNYQNPNSNDMEVFYIDTYPTMGIDSTKDVTQCYGTLAHEFQHMVSYNENVFIENTNEGLPSWLDEGLAEAARQVYTGQVLQPRIDYYNYSADITNGTSLLKWDGTLENYSLSYLFMEYLKEQVGIGDSVFTEVTKSKYNDYRAVAAVIQKYIDPGLTFGQFMTNFRVALFLRNSSGPYGFKGNASYSTIQQKIYTGGKTDLYGGGAVVTATNPITGDILVPKDKGASVNYFVTTYAETGVKNRGFYNTDKAILFFHNTATLNGVNYISGTKITAEGTYHFVNTLDAVNYTDINFTIDKTAPIISGATNTSTYNTSKTITFNEGMAMLNGNAFISGSTINASGNYTLVVTDDAGNTTTTSFSIIDDAALANSVIAQITALPTADNLVYSNKAAVVAARTAYDALTAAEKAIVTNLNALIRLELKMAKLDAALNCTVVNGVLTQYNGSEQALIIPENLAITSIGYQVFLNMTGLNSVSIPYGVLSIGDSAFYGCNIKTLAVPKSVTAIGANTFNSCTNLQGIFIPQSVTSIGTNAFYGCNSLTIYGISGSFAQQYATNNGILFEAISNKSVTFINYDSTIITVQSVPLCEIITPPTLPTRTNYAFCGWYQDSAYLYLWRNTADIVSADASLYAKWRPYGDIDNNGTVSSTDALMILQASSGKRTLNDEDKLVADVDNNSLVTATDALQVLQFASGKRTSFN